MQLAASQNFQSSTMKSKTLATTRNQEKGSQCSHVAPLHVEGSLPAVLRSGLQLRWREYRRDEQTQ